MKELGIYKQLVQLPYLTSYKKVVEAAISLDLFSQLETEKTAESLALEMGWDTVNTKTCWMQSTALAFSKEAGMHSRTHPTARNIL